jgi:hypothetical protein
MKRFVQFLLTAAAVLFAVDASAQPVPPRATAYATAPDIPYESVPNFLKLPTNIYLGEGIGVARNSKGHIFIFTRSGDTRLFEFDQNGTFVREIGQGLYGFEMAHGVRVDSQDNIWTVDEGTNMVVKFNPEGRVLMTMGRRPEAVEGLDPTATPVPPAEPYRFNRPTDVTWDPQGNIFVADGYFNSRGVKYDKNGRFIKAVGTRGTEPYQMNIPHSITADAQAMTKHEAVEVLPDLPQVVAVLVELEIARLLGAGVDENMPLGVGRDPDAFAHIDVGGQLHEVGHHFERDVRRVLQRFRQESHLGGRQAARRLGGASSSLGTARRCLAAGRRCLATGRRRLATAGGCRCLGEQGDGHRHRQRHGDSTNTTCFHRPPRQRCEM